MVFSRLIQSFEFFFSGFAFLVLIQGIVDFV